MDLNSLPHEREQNTGISPLDCAHALPHAGEFISRIDCVRHLLKQFDDWIFSEFPRINSAIDHGQREALSSLRSTGLSHVISISERLDCDHDKLSHTELSELVGNVGMFLSAILRHGCSIDGVEFDPAHQILQTAYTVYGFPPRDTLETYVFMNEPRNGRYKAFTILPDEQAFIDLTKKAVGQIRLALQELRELSLEKRNDAVERLVRAKLHCEQYRGFLQAFLAKDERGEAAVIPKVFYENFREYFPALSTCGREWGPPSAAFANDIMEFDLRLGLSDSTYVKHVESRLEHFLPEVQVGLQDALDSQSLLQQVVNQPAQLKCPFTLAKSLLQRDLVPLAVAVLELADSVGRAASSHWGLVANYLIKPHEAELNSKKIDNKIGVCPISGGAYEAHVVDPTRGASGMRFSEVQHFRDLRRKNPLCELLREALIIAASLHKESDSSDPQLHTDKHIRAAGA